MGGVVSRARAASRAAETARLKDLATKVVSKEGACGRAEFDQSGERKRR